MVKLEERHLNFFKDLLEGRSSITFAIYLKRHEESLREQLPRAQFLRLKFNCTEEMQSILHANNVTFSPDQTAIRQEIYLRNQNPADLDENGRLKPGYKLNMFDGAVNLFESGDEGGARKVVLKLIGYPKKMSSKRCFEELEDLEYFSEIEMRFGNEDTGRFLLALIASIERQYSHVDDVVIRAKEALKKS